MLKIDKILLENKAWVQETLMDDPEYFRRMAQSQQPDFLWIGCSDSRVPANKITGTHPGEVFVHRNIANLVVKNDMNVLSVLDYAVTHLQVKHVIVCGHYGCGGIKAALSGQSFGMLDSWLSHIKIVMALNLEELNLIGDETDRTNRLVELNVNQQISHLAQTATVSAAWAKGDTPQLHGLVYGLENGLLKRVCQVGPHGAKEV